VAVRGNWGTMGWPSLVDRSGRTPRRGRCGFRCGSSGGCDCFPLAIRFHIRFLLGKVFGCCGGVVVVGVIEFGIVLGGWVRCAMEDFEYSPSTG